MEKKHSNNCEQISALMDGEFEQGSKQCKHSLDKIIGCEDSQCQWERFHLLRDLLVEEKGLLANLDLSTRVSTALQDEPHRIGSVRWFKKSQSESTLWKQVVGMGVAASVAAVLVTSIQTVEPLTPESIQQSQFTSQFTPAFQSVVPATASFELAPEAPALEAPSLEEQQRLQRLFLQHTLSASESGLKGLLPYAKVVSYGRIPTQVAKVENSSTETDQQDIEPEQNP